MRTKIEAPDRHYGGAHMIIADGGTLAADANRARRPLHLVLTPSNPVTARKKWIAGSLEPRARRISTRRGAGAGQWQKPAAGGVTRVEGFSPGDCIVIRNARRRDRRGSSPMTRATPSKSLAGLEGHRGLLGFKGRTS